MGQFNSTIRVNTTSALPIPINLIASTSGTTGEFNETGTLEVGPFIDALFTGVGVLSTKQCGAKGAYVYVQSPSTNLYAIKLYGWQQIYEEFNEETFDGIESFATLQPGDSILVPLSAQQNGVVAASTFGTGLINYYIADRAGEFGKSVIAVTTFEDSYSYFVLDAELGEALPSVGVPFYSRSLGIATSDYTYTGYTIVSDKGYVLEFYRNSDSSQRIRVCINSRGEVADQLNLTTSWYFYDLDNKGWAALYNDGLNTFIKYFDGEQVYSQIIQSDSFDIYSDWNWAAADGSFLLGLDNYLNEGIYAYVIINKDKCFKVCQPIGWVDEDSFAVNIFANFVFLTRYDNDNGWYVSVEIYDTQGNQLQFIDLSGYQSNDLNWRFYGTNKVTFILNDYNNNYDYIWAYNGATNHLTSTNIDRTSYGSRNIYTNQKWIEDSIRPWNYTWNSGQFEPESLVLAYYNIKNEQSYFINIVTNHCQFIYLFDTDSDFSSYQFTNGPNKYIRLPNDGNGYSHEGGGFNRFYPAKNSFVFLTSTSNFVDGALTALSFTKNGVKETTVLSDLSSVYNGYNDITFKPVGDYVMMNWYNPYNNQTTYTMFYDNPTTNKIVKDSLVLPGEETGAGIWRDRFNSLLIRSWYYSSPRNWYFNTSNGKFTELTAGGNSFSAIKPSYATFLFNKSTVDQGINDGNILLSPNMNEVIGAAYYSDAAHRGYNNNMRLIKSGVVTNNVVLPTSLGSENSLWLGSNSVVYFYQEPDRDSLYTANVYDLNLTLQRTVQFTESINKVAMIGERFYVQTAVTDKISKLFLLTTTNVATMTAFESDIAFNDYYWWDYLS